MSVLFTFEQISYSYPAASTSALNGLTMQIPEGKRCVLLGQNGCGKSTLFLHANGILRPSEGQLLLRGQQVKYDRRSLVALRQAVGVVFQDPEQQIVANTVMEDISYGLCNMGLPDEQIRQMVEEILERFRLSQLRDRPVHHLSLGQKKRVALAGVMAMRPQLLLLDEPTAFLDRKSTRELMREMEEIHLQGTTVLMATHDLDLAYEWAEWIFVMEWGRLVLEGTPEKVFACREIMESLHLGVPLLFDVWESLLINSQRIRESHYPRTVEELRQQLQREELLSGRDAK